MTAATYAEGTVLYPEAGGSSSFARHAFNELISFGAAWAQMLVYVVTVATSAFFVPHYLSIFWEPLKTNPWDIVGGAVVIVILVDAQHRRRPGGGEALDRARGARLRDPGAARPARLRSSSSARRSWSTTSTGAWRRPGRTSRSRFPSRCSPTPGWRPSPTSPRRRASRRAACPTPTSSSPAPSSRST